MVVPSVATGFVTYCCFVFLLVPVEVPNLTVLSGEFSRADTDMVDSDVIDALKLSLLNDSFAPTSPAGRNAHPLLDRSPAVAIW